MELDEARLRRGVDEWNAWRVKESRLHVNLTNAVLADVDLVRANLANANLSGADLRGANLAGADLSYSRLDGVVANGATMSGAVLSYIQCGQPGVTASLRQVNLTSARLFGTFDDVDFSDSDFTGSSLSYCHFARARFDRAKFRGATIGGCTFSDVTFVGTADLEDVQYRGPSEVGIVTLRNARGAIPGAFLRGCGLSEVEIRFSRLFDVELTQSEITDLLYEIDTLRGASPIQVNPLFISYSHRDAPFVDALERVLDARGVRYWRDVHHTTAGRLEKQIDRALRLHPTVLLVLSASSVESDWVEWEASRARELEKELKRDVLCPVALDDAWKECVWPGPLRRQIMDYNILDFASWFDAEVMARQADRLLTGLRIYYRPEAADST